MRTYHHHLKATFQLTGKHMLKKDIARLLLVIITTAIVINPVQTFAGENEKITPIKKQSQEKFRIGYLEGGSYSMYPAILLGIANGLQELGWLEEFSVPESVDTSKTAEIWQWFSDHISSEYIEFVADAYWSADWKKELRAKNKAAIIDRLTHEKDLDLIIANGTWAGQDLANNDHSTPVLVCSTGNPIQAEIIKSAEDSGFPHVHARVDPTRFQRQIMLFHDIIGFKKLGIAYIDTVAGRSYAAVEDVRKMSQEIGFTLEECLLPDKVEGQALTDLTIDCHKKLAPKIDAMYITIQTGITLQGMPQLLAPLEASKIPTFSQAGSREVEHGVLLSISQANYRYVSKFHAETIARIFNGTPPNNIGQVFEAPPKIAINIAEAEVIGFNPSVDILSAADEIYNEIKVTD